MNTTLGQLPARAIALGLSLLAVALAAGCSGSGADLAACKSAMQGQFAQTVASGTTGTKPDACKGLSDDQLRQAAGEVLNEAISSGAFASGSASSTANAANPVPIVEQAGASTTARYGDTNIYGDKYADGDLGQGESLTVTTFADRDAMQADFNRNDGWAPTDSQSTIAGDLFTVTVYAVQDYNFDTGDTVATYPVPPTDIEQRVHGTLITG